MVQLLGLVLISWMFIWLFAKGDLSVLGLMPNSERLNFFTILFIVSGLLSATTFLLRMYFSKEEYTLAPSLTINSVLLEIWHQFRTVFTEELICRGALLYVFIKKIGSSKAILITSLLFAVLHWINSGVWGNFTQMSIVFAFTFAMGLLLAFSYAKTFSLLIPFAIHFGWNLVQNYIFPDTATGQHVFILSKPPPEITISYLSFFVMILVPKVSVLIIDYLIIRKHRQVAIP